MVVIIITAILLNPGISAFDLSFQAEEAGGKKTQTTMK